ncbi:hypothetical protein G7Y89_g13128 [Cudoniella acicularis]|uniref:lytic cellulose monooxygenase (C4-dehydrogenating) n=1 Tax=Cudoniella acicularis TaxID=354080 RepID=A0A8H4RBB2_9HELO|nr:hypothetical protein G7Y89_g13128 [Cudoniella acicularis]
MRGCVIGTLFLLATEITVNGHYVFSKFLIDGAETPDWQYFRPIPEQPANPEYDRRLDPIYDVDSVDMRCNRNGSTAGYGVATLTLPAGQEVGFGVANNSRFMSLGRNGRIFHQGPGQAYLSRAADGDLESYEGDGDWFKIGEYGVKDATHWVLDQHEYWLNFTIPETTPPGKYLFRVEQMFLRDPGLVQFYISCAHVEIFGPGGGRPGPLVQFPGAYKKNDSNINIPREHSMLPPMNLLNPKYVNPGPGVWTG